MQDKKFRLPAQNGYVQFAMIDEARKLRDLVKADPQPHPTLCSYDDLIGFPFRPSDIGFLIMLMPGQMASQGGNFAFSVTAKREQEAVALLRKLRVEQFDTGLLVASTACSWDTAMLRIRHITSIQYAAVAFTTPERFQIIAENPNLIR